MGEVSGVFGYPSSPLVVDASAVESLSLRVLHSAGTPYGQMIGLDADQFGTLLSIMNALMAGRSVRTGRGGHG